MILKDLIKMNKKQNYSSEFMMNIFKDPDIFIEYFKENPLKEAEKRLKEVFSEWYDKYNDLPNWRYDELAQNIYFYQEIINKLK